MFKSKPAENSCFARGFHSGSSQWYLLVDWRVRPLQPVWGGCQCCYCGMEKGDTNQGSIYWLTLLLARAYLLYWYILIHYEKVWLRYRHMMTCDSYDICKTSKLSIVVSLHHPTSLPKYPKLNYKRIQSLCLLRQPPGMSPMRQRWNIIFKQPSRCWVHAER